MSIVRRGHRDFRIDFFRGLALLFIFVDHVPDNVLANFTLKNFGFADAAEVFVLLAGYSAVLAYGRAFETEGFQARRHAAGAAPRTSDIYLWHLGLLLICGFGLVAIAHLLANPSYIDGLKLYLFAENPPRAFALAATLANQPNLLNILPLYVALFVFWAPLLLWLVVRCPLLRLRFGGGMGARQCVQSELAEPPASGRLGVQSFCLAAVDDDRCCCGTLQPARRYSFRARACSTCRRIHRVCSAICCAMGARPGLCKLPSPARGRAGVAR